MKYLLLLLFVVGCTRSPSYKAKRAQSGDIERWENDEVVCYIYEGIKAGGLSCKWKNKEL